MPYTKVIKQSSSKNDKKRTSLIYNFFSNPDLDFETKKFNTLAFSGMALNVLSGIFYAFAQAPFMACFAFFLRSLLIFFEYLIAKRFRLYKLFYIFTICTVYCFLFPMNYIKSGIVFGSMFAYAIANTFIMLRGRVLAGFITLEAGIYSFVIYYNGVHSGGRGITGQGGSCFIVLANTLIPGLILGITFTFYIYNYKVQNNLLTLARDEATKANETRSTFFANVNHELRTPVHVIMGMTEMILRESPSDEITEYARSSQKAGELLQALINNLLDFSNLENGNIVPMNLNFSLSKVIEEYIVFAQNGCRKKELGFDFTLEASIPTHLLGDEIMLKQIFYNLISNAINYTEQGRVFLFVDWKSHYGETEPDQPNGHLVISLKDTGIGMPKEQIDHIFDNTKRNNTDFSGSGLGLAIVKQIVTAMNGTISAESIPLVGSTFTVEIPFIAISGSEDAAESFVRSGDDDSSFVAHDARLLVVDDNEMNLNVISLLLKRIEAHIDSVTSAREALKLISKNHYDFMLFDYMMPEMDGVELLKQIKINYPEVYAQTPIYAFSANTNADTRQLIINSGFTGYLAKPIDGRLLEMVIKDNLPQDLIEIHGGDNIPKAINQSDLSAYKKLLASYDISLNEGLKYMSGDMNQYVNIARLVISSYLKNKKKIETAFNNDFDLKDFGIYVHALKGNAKFVGAMNLYHIAYLIEQKAADNDRPFASNALPLFFYEWGTAIEGLSAFVDTYDASGYTTKKEDTIDTTDYINRLIEYTDNFQPEPAIQLIAAIISQQAAPMHEDALKQARAYLEELEYDEALNIFKEINK